MIVRKSSSHFTSSSTSSTNSSVKTPSAFAEEWDADDEDAMSTADDYVPSRPLTVAIPTMGAHGPYCPRRPNLREILANTSPPPWTLAAFMAYLSNNHCLETLEFTMDSGRYRKHYQKMMSRAGEDGLPPAKDREYVQALWQRLVEAYIQPNGSREVNLPSDVRDPILSLKPSTMPPAPEKLDPAVAKIYELMEESVLVPFLNSVYPQSAHAAVQSCPYDTSDDSVSAMNRTYDDRNSRYTRRTRYTRSSPPPQTAVEPHANTYTAPAHYRQSAPPLSASASPHRSRFSVKLTTTTSSPAAILDGAGTGSDGSGGAGPGMTEDSESTGTNESPMTPPPTSPPGSNEAQSPKRDSAIWKKLGRLSGMKPGKKKSHSRLKTDEDSHSSTSTTQRSV